MVNLINWLNRAYQAYLQRKILQRIVRFMAVVVVFCTTYALILPAITLEAGTVCGLTEHTHTDACYVVSELLSCTQPVSEAHTHGSECYADVKELQCELTEHQHEEGCYPVTEPEATEQMLLEEADPTADVETDQDWEETLSATQLTGDWSADIISIARTQLGYTESQKNYITDENGVTYGYTRYGQWYGEPYADWSATFVSFCLHYARVTGIPAEQDCGAWLTALQSAGIYRASGDYTPVAGDIVFMDRSGDGLADQVGIIETVTVSEADGFTSYQIIAGDQDGKVDRFVMDAGYQGVLGYAMLPMEPVQELHDYLADDGTFTQVYLGEDAEVRSSARLSVTELTDIDEQYADMEQQVRQAIDEEVRNLTLLDISFFDADGAYISVSDLATVSICYPKQVFGDGQVKVFHFVDGIPVELERVECQTIAPLSEEEEVAAQTVLTFQTDGFSVFALVEVYEKTSRIVLENPATLDGNSYYIVSSNERYYMKDAQDETSKVGLAKGDYTGEDSLNGATTWTFLMQDDGTFKIRNNQDKYLVMADEDIYGYAGLTLTDTEDAATAFTIRAVNGKTTNNKDAEGMAEISYDGPNAIAHYLNVYSGSTDFRGWKDSAGQDKGSKVFLHLAAIAPDPGTGDENTVQLVTDLNGDYAIVNINKEDSIYKALAITPVKVENVDGLTTTDVTLTTVDDVKCVEGAAQLWTFHPTSTKGVYHISTKIDGADQYLRLLDSHKTATSPDGSGSLTLGATPQDITVFVNGSGAVGLSATVTDNEKTYTGYVNLDTTSKNYWTYKENATDGSGSLYLCKKTSEDSMFTITRNGKTITVNLRDVAGNHLYTARQDLTLTDGQILTFKDIIAAPEGYTFLEAKLSTNSNLVDVVAVEGATDCIFRFHGPTYSDDQSNKYSRSDDSTVTLTYYKTGTALAYQLNSPATSDWINEPQLSTAEQTVPEAGTTLYAVENANAGGTFVVNTISHRSEVGTFYDTHYNTADDFRGQGREYRFLYWQATVDGETWQFPEGAAVQKDADGNCVVADINGVDRILPVGTLLQGQWILHSEVVLFYVNFGDTMLAGETRRLATSTDPSHYTDIVALGHLYDADGTIDTVYEGESDKPFIDKSHNEAIQAQIAFAYDPAASGTQLVIDGIARHNGTDYQFVPISNCNETQLEAAVAAYIQANTDTKKQITIKINGLTALVDQNKINSDNYMLYWYSQRNVPGDGWHLDGVLVAKTHPMTITKTFSGLTEAQAKNALKNMNFEAYLIDKNGNADKHVVLGAATEGQEGIYTAASQPYPGRNIYQWTLESVLGQRYAIRETGYKVDNYDCSSLVSVHYKDGQIKYLYGRDTTFEFTDEEAGTGTGLFHKEYGEAYDLIGGNVTGVIFANFYTPKGTGAFSISKVQTGSSTNRLPNAEFTLTDSNGESRTETTNENGAVHFDNLAPGTYTLEETAAPAGYSDHNLPSYTVVVSGDSVNGITVTIDGKPVYTTAEGIKEVFLVENTPTNTSLTITTYFTDIMEGELAEIVANSHSGGTNPYYLQVKPQSGEAKTLYLKDATRVTGKQAYTWTVQGVDTGDYTITQHNYHHAAYADTVVSARDIARQTGTDDVITYPVVTKDEQAGTASFVATMTDAIDTVEITNRYTNTFQLRLRSVDADNNTTLLSGAAYNIFSPNPNDANGSQVLTFTDSNGQQQTGYYVTDTTESGDDGISTYPELKLSTADETNLYAFDQALVPDGYLKRSKPVVTSVGIGTEGYFNGVYTIDVPVKLKSSAKVQVTVDVQWDVPWNKDECPAVTLNLYRAAGQVGAEKIKSTTVSASENWTWTWTDLPYQNDQGEPYTYYVAQSPVNGFATTHSDTAAQLTVGTDTVYAVPATGGEEERSATVTNTSGYELPNTGGSGTSWMAPFGLLLMLAVFCRYWLGTIEKKRQGGRE